MGHARSLEFPLVIPHSDGADVVEAVGAGVPQSRIGERVWIWNGQVLVTGGALSVNASDYPAAVKHGGTIVVYGMSQQQSTLPTFWFMRSQVTLRFVFIYDIPAEDRKAGLEEIQTLLASNALSHTVAATLPLTEIARAHDLVAQGTVAGNIVLSIHQRV